MNAMKAIQVNRFGDPDVLQVVDLATPEPTASEVLVEVRAIGVNPVDAICRSGAAPWVSPPFVPGFDGAGVVVKAGPDSRWSPGDRVYFTLTASAYADYVLCTPDRLFALPESVSFETGAALGIPYFTAYGALFLRAGLTSGQTLLVRGASGAVGSAAIQWAVARGVKVFGTAGSEAGLASVIRNGAACALDHRKLISDDVLAVTEGCGVDLILELHSASLDEDLDLLAPHGNVLVVGDRSPVCIDPYKLTSRCTSILGFNVSGSLSASDMQTINAALGTGLADGSLRPNIAQRFPLTEAAAAHGALGRSGLNGKIVLIP